MNIINPMKNLYIATIGEDFARWIKKTQSGLELDQFCMAENLDEPKFDGLGLFLPDPLPVSWLGGR